MSGAAAFRAGIYNAFFRRTSVYVTVCVAASYASTEAYFGVTERMWASINKGVRANVIRLPRVRTAFPRGGRELTSILSCSLASVVQHSWCLYWRRRTRRKRGLRCRPTFRRRPTTTMTTSGQVARVWKGNVGGHAEGFGCDQASPAWRRRNPGWPVRMRGAIPRLLSILCKRLLSFVESLRLASLPGRFDQADMTHIVAHRAREDRIGSFVSLFPHRGLHQPSGREALRAFSLQVGIA